MNADRLTHSTPPIQINIIRDDVNSSPNVVIQKRHVTACFSWKRISISLKTATIIKVISGFLSRDMNKPNYKKWDFLAHTGENNYDNKCQYNDRYNNGCCCNEEVHWYGQG